MRRSRVPNSRSSARRAASRLEPQGRRHECSVGRPARRVLTRANAGGIARPRSQPSAVWSKTAARTSWSVRSGRTTIAVREYARAHPDITFIATGNSNRRRSSERFPTSTGSGQHVPVERRTGYYARRKLGWDSAATFGDNNVPGYQVGGFIAGFCSLGGHVAMSDRLFLDRSRGLDPDRLVGRIPRSRRPLLTGTTAGGPVGGTRTMALPWEQTHAPLNRHLLVGWGCSIPTHGCFVASWGRARSVPDDAGVASI